MSKQNTFKFSPSIISKAIIMALFILGVSLIGSTAVNAEGVSVETKLHAHHHEDAAIKDDHHDHEK